MSVWEAHVHYGLVPQLLRVGRRAGGGVSILTALNPKGAGSLAWLAGCSQVEGELRPKGRSLGSRPGGFST